ncbi:hypothetical protein [Bradyrhizobium sp. Leo170]|uniref:hypothetical protein n=1 Tax=Bradyrhizobium sp. Leo170 TaxID=1571199 RepID=UPI00102E64FF|nr:hypothetical protein [Bradyrhizobium sp. Leo170]TAI60684.1 hypothetical protein CWO89_39345 [Bradyrhizobium sp. Leo170]
MKWMKERDLLIAQTMAFVQSVTGKKPDAELLSPATETTVRATITTAVVNVEAVLAEPTAIPVAVPPKPAQTMPARTMHPEARPSQAKPPQIAGLDLPADFQSEIRARVASFRAHQERFTREREEYCRATMAKVRASLGEGT